MKIYNISAFPTNNNVNRNSTSQTRDFATSFTALPEESEFEKNLPAFVKRWIKKMNDWQGRVDRETTDRYLSQTPAERDADRAYEEDSKRWDHF